MQCVIINKILAFGFQLTYYAMVQIENYMKCLSILRQACELIVFSFLQIRKKKKVLLRERKRHTACRVASARYAALSPNGGGGTPGFPPVQTWDEVPLPSRPGMGYPPSRPGMGYPPHQQERISPSAGGGTPAEVWTDTQSENISFSIIRLLAVKITVLPDGINSAPSLFPKKSLIRLLVSPSLLKGCEESIFPCSLF